MTLHHAIHHRQPQARAALALGGVEGLKTATPGLLVHPDSGIGDLHVHMARRIVSAATAAGDEAGAQGESTAIGHGIDGIENEIGEGVAQLAFRAHDLRQLLGELGAQLNDDAALLGQIAPARSREVDDLLEHAIARHPRQHHLSLARSIELAHARDGLGDVLDGGLNGDQAAARPLTQTRLALQQRLGVQRRRGDRVVDIVRDTARHLPQRPQALLLHDRLLRLAQIVVGALQLPVQLCLMRRQRDMLTQLPQELAIGAAEAVGLAPRRHQHTKDLIFNQ